MKTGKTENVNVKLELSKNRIYNISYGIDILGADIHALAMKIFFLNRHSLDKPTNGQKEIIETLEKKTKKMQFLIKKLKKERGNL